jgi:uncharacterized protein YihD (DUF1040 family)
MARPKKQGLDYWPFDCDIYDDTAVQLLDAKYENDGMMALIRIYSRIYKHEGYYLEWTTDEKELLAYKIHMEPERLQEIVDYCIVKKLFDAKLYETFNILTSKRIQRTFYEAANRRNDMGINEEWVLIEELMQHLSRPCGVNATLTPLKRTKCNINPESKVKESKEKKSKVKESKEADETFISADMIGDYIKKVSTGKQISN